MNSIDRSHLHDLMERERETFRERHPALGSSRGGGEGPPALRRADELDDPVAGRLPRVRGAGRGRAGSGTSTATSSSTSAWVTREAWPGTRRRPPSRRSRGRPAAGITLMLPTDDAEWVGAEMARRFGVPTWSFTLTATDANRFVIRWARALTGRDKIVVHNWCYHGTVDETFATLDDNGAVVEREGNTGKPVPLDETTRVVEINDLRALEAALAHGDVAACLFEPALTNIGIVLPGARLPRRRARAVHEVRDAADHRRDAHDLRGAGRMHEGVGPGAGLRHDRQDARRRDPQRRLRDVVGGRRADLRRTPNMRPPTWAAPEARSPATRCRSLRCGPPSARSSRTTRSSG